MTQDEINEYNEWCDTLPALTEKELIEMLNEWDFRMDCEEKEFADLRDRECLSLSTRNSHVCL